MSLLREEAPFREALHKPSMVWHRAESEKCDFRIPCEINSLRLSISAVRPWTAVNSEFFRVSLAAGWIAQSLPD
jgi:hypothetical protein